MRFAIECAAVGCSRRTKSANGYCFQHTDMAWQPVDTIPIGETVVVRTVKGIICRARHAGRVRWIKRADKWGPRRVFCFRVDGRTCGDVRAVAWRKL